MRRTAGHATLLMLVLASGCTAAREPVLDPAVAAMRVRPTVVFVTGITGTELIDRTDGSFVWGDFHSAFRPHDRGYGMVRPLGTAPHVVVAGEAMMEVTHGCCYRKEIYRPVERTFEANGYHRGDDLFIFGYDWRQSNVDSARELARLLDSLDTERPVVLICQSNGGYLCRWAVRFGDVGLDEAELGIVRPPRVRVESLILLGTTNVGSIRILREIDRGRTYVPIFGRHLSGEAFFTFESLYQDLPPWRDDAFVDERGNRINVDLYDAGSWERYGWSIFGEKAAAHADARTDLFGTRETRLAFLQRALDDARRFHLILRDGPPPPDATRYYSLQNRTNRTINRAMLVERNGEWRTLFLGDREVDSRPELASVMATLGDRHATIQGQDALPNCERARLAEPIIRIDGNHVSIFTSDAAHEAILRIIGERGF